MILLAFCYSLSGVCVHFSHLAVLLSIFFSTTCSRRFFFIQWNLCNTCSNTWEIKLNHPLHRGRREWDSDLDCTGGARDACIICVHFTVELYCSLCIVARISCTLIAAGRIRNSRRKRVGICSKMRRLEFSIIYLQMGSTHSTFFLHSVSAWIGWSVHAQKFMKIFFTAKITPSLHYAVYCLCVCVCMFAYVTQLIAATWCLNANNESHFNQHREH